MKFVRDIFVGEKIELDLKIAPDQVIAPAFLIPVLLLLALKLICRLAAKNERETKAALLDVLAPYGR